MSQRTPKNSWSRAVSTAWKLTENRVNLREGKVDGTAEPKETESGTHATLYLSKSTELQLENVTMEPQNPDSLTSHFSYPLCAVN